MGFEYQKAPHENRGRWTYTDEKIGSIYKQKASLKIDVETEPYFKIAFLISSLSVYAVLFKNNAFWTCIILLKTGDNADSPSYKSWISYIGPSQLAR